MTQEEASEPILPRSPYDAMGLGAYQMGVLPGLPALPGVGELIGSTVGTIVDSVTGMFSNLFGSGDNNVHIPAQEQAAASIVEIANNVDYMANRSLLTQTDLEQAIIGVRTIAQGFSNLVDACIAEGRCDAARARQGVRDVNSMAEGLAKSWEQAIIEHFDAIPNLPPTYGEPYRPPATGEGVFGEVGNVLPYVIGGYLLFRLI